MGKNDYRRSMIMLRGLEKGYSGHARLEKRVTMGTMDFVVQTPDQNERLEAIMVGPRGNTLSAKALGSLKADGRGQRGLLASFDPRNISGMDLDNVTAAVIASVDQAGARPVLVGYVNGSKPINWAEVTRLIEEMFTPAQQAPPDVSEMADNIPEPVTETVPENAEMAEPENPPDSENQTAKSPAGAYLNVDMSKPWPADAENLRFLFLTSPVYEPFQKEDYVFVRAAMAEETGISHCAVGVRAENGQIAGICYAIPMPYSPNPPAGLEDYEWIGNGNSGWWVTCERLNAE